MNACSCICISIRIQEPTDFGIIVPGIEIVKSRLGIVVIPPVAEGSRLLKLSSRPL